MRKRSCLMLILLLCLMIITTACGKNNRSETDNEGEVNNETGIIYEEEGFIVGQDSSYMFQFSCDGGAIVKAENGYYISINSVLYYADEELNLTPLCNKPNCLHRFEEADSSNVSSCKACTGASALPRIQYYDGKIYSSGQKDVISREPFKNASGSYNGLYVFESDGSSRKLIDDYASNEIGFVLHRGYIYYSFKAIEQPDKGSEQKPISKSCLVRMSVDTGEIESLREFIDCQVHEIYGYRNYMYFRTDNAIYIYDIEKNEFINSFEGERMPLFWFMDDKLIYYYSKDNDYKVYISELDGTGEEYIFTRKNKGGWKIGADNRYIYEDNRSTREYLELGADHIINYYDKDTYEYLGSINLGKTKYYRFGYGDEKYFFYYGVNDDGTRSLMYFDKDELAGGSVTLKELVNLGEDNVF